MKQADFLSHAVAAIIVTILAGMIYLTVQQSYRSGANDPQLQTARDISERLAGNRSVDGVFTADTIDLSRSLAVFTILYNAAGDPVRSNGLLDGKLPRIPGGIFDYARKYKEDVLTWQPQRGIRMALVVEPVHLPGADIAFVAVGRSLKEVERRVDNLTMMSLAGWLVCMGLILAHRMITHLRSRNRGI